MTDLTQPPLPDMPDVSETPDAPDVLELLTRVAEGESDKDIAAMTAGALIGLRADVQALSDTIGNFINVVVVRNSELSERINVLGARHDQMYGRVDTALTGLAAAVRTVGEQQQYVTDETDKAKAELKELATGMMANPGKMIKAFMGGGFMGGSKKNRQQIEQDNTTVEIEGVQNDLP